MRLFLAALAAATAVCLVTPGQTAGSRGPVLVVKKLTLKPGVVIPGNGAEVNVTVQFAQPAPRIAQVQVAGYVTGTGYGPAYALTAGNGGRSRGPATCRSIARAPRSAGCSRC